MPKATDRITTSRRGVIAAALFASPVMAMAAPHPDAALIAAIGRAHALDIETERLEDAMAPQHVTQPLVDEWLGHAELVIGRAATTPEGVTAKATFLRRLLPERLDGGCYETDTCSRVTWSLVQDLLA